MHTKPMAESDGQTGKEKPYDGECRKCGKGPVVYQEWESSCGGYTDYKIRCKSCDYVWWHEGSDS